MSKPNKQGITFAKNDVEIIARETLYRGFFSLDLYRFRHRLFNGGMSGEVMREIFERGRARALNIVEIHFYPAERAGFFIY